MAEEIATGYIQLMPSAKGMKEAVERETKGIGTSSGAAFSDAMSKQVTADSAKITTAVSRATTKASTGFLASMRAAVQQFGGSQVVLGQLSQNASQATQRLSGLVRGSSELGTVTGGLKSGLLGVSGLLGGPWALAVGGGALLLNHFAEEQQAATDRAKAFYDTLDKQTGAVTQGSAQIVAKGILDALSSVDQAKLKSFGVSIEDATTAVLRGGPAYDEYIRKLQSIVAAQTKTAGTLQRGRVGLSDQSAAVRQLISQLEAQHDGLTRGTADWQKDAAAQRIAKTVSDDMALATSGSTAKLLERNGVLTDMSQSGSAAMLKLGQAGRDAAEKLSLIPTDVRVTASAIGLKSIESQANNAANAVYRLAAAFVSANSIASDGEAHGADRSLVLASAQQRAAALQAQARAQVAALQAAMNKHNAGISTGGSSKSGGASGGSSAVSAAANARTALADLIGGTFTSDLATADRAGVGRTGASLVSAVRRALSGSKETALVALLRKDTKSLQTLAGRRSTVATALQDAQQRLDGLRSEQASTVSTVTQSALGELTGARSASGVARVLTRQLAKVTSFHSNLSILAKRGLPPVFLQQLVNAGLDGAYTAAALVRANDADFSKITALTNSLSSEASGLGKDSGSLLYDSGVAAAQGLIKGLASQESAIDKQMLKIATAMTTAIKKALGIHSPSRVFRDLGRQIPAGLGLGVDDGTSSVHSKLRALAGNYGGALGNVSGSVKGGVTPSVPVQMEVHQYGMDPATAAAEISNALVWRNRR